MPFIMRPGWSQEGSPLGWWRGVFAYGGPQTLFVPGTSCISPSFTEADACWFFLCHQDTPFLLDGEAEVVGIPAQGHCCSVGRDAAVQKVELSWSLGIWV